MLIPIGFFAASAASAPTEPVLTNLRIWYDASDSSTIGVTSGRANSIANKASGYTWTLSQGTTTRQPEIVAAAQNGLQALRFSRTRNDLLLTTNPSHPLSNATTFTVFIAAKTTSTYNGYKFAIGWNGDGTNFLLYQASQKAYTETGSGTNSITGTNNLTNTANIQMVSMISGGAKYQKIFTNETQLESVSGGTGTFVISNSGSASNNRTSLGAGFNNETSVDMDFYEIIAYPNTLTQDEIDLNVSYLSNKWGL